MSRARRACLVVGAAATASLALVLGHLLLGRSDLPARDVLGALTGTGEDPTVELIVLRYRLPRVLVGLGAGALLALSGVLVQVVVRNPLAEPGTTGVGGGAALGVVLAALLGLDTTYAAALVGALAGGGLLLLLGRGAPAVVGILLGAVLAAATSLLLVLDSSPTATVLRWLVGSLNARTIQDWDALWPWLIALPVLSAALAPWMNAWALGPTTATSLGLPQRCAPAAILLMAVLAGGVAIAAAGAVTFVGLVAPHVGRLLVGPDHRLLLPVAASLGAVLLAGADLVAVSVGVDVPGARDVSGVPVGAVTALLGAPLLVHLARKELR